MKILIFGLMIIFYVFNLKGQIPKLHQTDIEKVLLVKNNKEFLKLLMSVELDNSSSGLDNLWGLYAIAQDNYYALASGANNYIWNKYGKFIGKAGNLGKGPGEYTSIAGLSAINNEVLCVTDGVRGFLILYKIGKEKIEYLDTVDIVQKNTMPGIQYYYPRLVMHLPNGNYMLEYSCYSAGMHRIYIADGDFNIINKCSRNDIQEKITPVESKGYSLSYIYDNSEYIKKSSSKKTLIYKRKNNIIFLYDYNGNFIHNKIKTKNTEYSYNFTDKTGKLFMVMSKELDFKEVRSNKLFPANSIELYRVDTGRFIKELTAPFSSWRDENTITHIMPVGKLARFELSPDKKKIVVTIYEIDFGI